MKEKKRESETSIKRTIKQMAEIQRERRAFPDRESQIRWLIYNAPSNGMDDFKVIQRVGRRILIDQANWDRWIESGRAGRK